MSQECRKEICEIDGGSSEEGLYADGSPDLYLGSVCRYLWYVFELSLELVAHTYDAGNPVTIPLDFSEVVGEQSFYKEYQDIIEGSEVYASFEKFVKVHFKQQQQGAISENPTSGEHIRPGVRALMTLQRNNYGEPILLAPHRIPEGFMEKQFLCDLLRSVFTTLYGMSLSYSS